MKKKKEKKKGPWLVKENEWKKQYVVDNASTGDKNLPKI